MNRVDNIFGALVVWIVSSVSLLFLCVFSLNYTVILAALVVAAASLVGGAVAFATKHNRLGLVVAAGPAFVLVSLLVLAGVCYFIKF